MSIAGKADVFTSASPQARVAIVNAALTLARAFVESDEFKRRYADHREANGPDPLPPEPTPTRCSPSSAPASRTRSTACASMFDEITPEQRDTLEEGFEDMRARLTEMEKGPRHAELEKALQGTAAAWSAEREQAMKELDAVCPADPRALVANRLRRFLDVSEDIDFTAKLVEQDRKKAFADAALEASPAEWKMLFSGRKTRHRRRPGLRPEMARRPSGQRRQIG